MSIQSFNFTRAKIRKLPIPTIGRDTYRDKATTGLQLRVNSKGVKSFSFTGKLNGKFKRITIGNFGDISVSDARIKANELRLILKEGVDPILAKRARKLTGVTLGQCLTDYLEVHSELAESTVKKYKNDLNNNVKSWLSKPMKDITRSDVARKHRKISERSPSTANRVMRIIRALFNFANQEYEDKNGEGLFPQNPVSRLSHQRLWNDIPRRNGYLKPHQLKPWFEATEKLPEMTKFGNRLRDYLQLVLFTGLRLNEALQLKWEHIDLKDKTLFIPKTKNKKSHSLPLSDYVLEIFNRRLKEKENEYVFPACYGDGHLKEPKKAIEKVRGLTDIYFTTHDLRRTFTTIAESLDLSSYAIKRLLNHSMKRDVTAGYIIWDVERLRAPMQKITGYLRKSIL